MLLCTLVLARLFACFLSAECASAAHTREILVVAVNSALLRRANTLSSSASYLDCSDLSPSPPHYTEAKTYAFLYLIQKWIPGLSTLCHHGHLLSQFLQFLELRL